jgi:tRNA (guanosine-2'-O-)-methyltransferase
MDKIKEDILSYFQGFLTEYKIALFEQKVLERTRHFTFILEDLFHPHNASAILRSCDCFGIQDIHMIENNHRFKNEKDISLGSKKWLSLHHYNDQSNPESTCIDQLKSKGYTIAALSPHHNDISINELPLEKKVAFVLGAEKTGLTAHSLDHADLHVKIPMHGFTESLNVSVTAALTMYDVTQRMRKSTLDWQLSAEEQWQLKMIWTLRSIRSTRDIVKHYLQNHPEASSHFQFSEFLQ